MPQCFCRKHLRLPYHIIGWVKHHQSRNCSAERPHIYCQVGMVWPHPNFSTAILKVISTDKRWEDWQNEKMEWQLHWNIIPKDSDFVMNTISIFGRKSSNTQLRSDTTSRTYGCYDNKERCWYKSWLSSKWIVKTWLHIIYIFLVIFSFTF